MPTGLPGDPQEDGFKAARGSYGGGTPGTGFGPGGGFGGSFGGGGGGFFSAYPSAYNSSPAPMSWGRRLRNAAQPMPLQGGGGFSNPYSSGGGLNTNATMTGGPFIPGASGGSGGGNGGWIDAWGNATAGNQTGWDASSIAMRAIAAGGAAGMFDPYGSQGLLNMQRQNMISGMGAQQAGAVNQARSMYGDDPQMAAYAALQSRLGGQHAMASSLAGLQSQSALQNQQWLQNLFGSVYGSQNDWMARDQSARLAK